MKQWAKPNENQMVCLCICVCLLSVCEWESGKRVQNTLKRSDGNDNDRDGQMVNILLAF